MRWPSAVLALAPPPRPCEVSFAGPRGLRITAIPASYSFAVHPPRSFSPPSEYLRNTAHHPSFDQVVPSLRFFASSRHRHRGFARHDGFHTIAAVRPRVFSTPRRFAPHVTLRAYFVPLARPGFSLQGVSLVKSRPGSSPWPCPLMVTARPPLLAERPSRSPTSGPCSPHESVTLDSRLSSPTVRSPHGLSLPQGLLHSGR